MSSSSCDVISFLICRKAANNCCLFFIFLFLLLFSLSLILFGFSIFFLFLFYCLSFSSSFFCRRLWTNEWSVNKHHFFYSRLLISSASFFLSFVKPRLTEKERKGCFKGGGITVSVSIKEAAMPAAARGFLLSFDTDDDDDDDARDVWCSSFSLLISASPTYQHSSSFILWYTDWHVCIRVTSLLWYHSYSLQLHAIALSLSLFSIIPSFIRHFNFSFCLFPLQQEWIYLFIYFPGFLLNHFFLL